MYSTSDLNWWFLPEYSIYKKIRVAIWRQQTCIDFVSKYKSYLYSARMLKIKMLAVWGKGLRKGCTTQK